MSIRSAATAIVVVSLTSLVWSQPLYVSFEEDFTRQAPTGLEYVSDGDLCNGFTGAIYKKNRELLKAFQRPDTCDLGLDAVDVIDDSPAGELIAFSTEISQGASVKAGDVLFSNGAVFPHSALFAYFNPPPRCELGLDGIQFIGDPQRIREFAQFLLENPGLPPSVAAQRLKDLGLDIWFSTETTPNRVIGGPLPFLDGDILSVVAGGIVVPQAVLMAAAPAPGIPGLDRGVDGIVCSRNGDIANTFFSTDIANIVPLLTDADIIGVGAAAPILDFAAISAPFGAPAPYLGLDAISFFK